MNTIHREQLVNQLNWRYATKQFDPSRKINAEDWAALEHSLVMAPSSYGLQPWKFIVVNDPSVREKLVASSWGQRQVAEASHLVVFTYKADLGEQDIDAYVDRIAEVRGVPRESLSQLRDMMVQSIVQGRDREERGAWAARQVYIALGNLLNSAALLGIDACPMEGIEPEKYGGILGLEKSGLRAVAACALGYRAEADTYSQLKKVRFPKEEVVLQV
jgi:nitroreductase